MFNQFTGHATVRGQGGAQVPWLEVQQVPTLMVIYGMGYATAFAVVVLLYRRALSKHEELGLNAFEVFYSQTSMIENGFQGSVGVICAVTAALLPTNVAGLAGYFFFLIPLGMWIIGSRRGKARQSLAASQAKSVAS